MNSFWLIEDYISANDFLRSFDRSFQKNVKSHVFLKSEKNVKYVFSNTGSDTLLATLRFVHPVAQPVILFCAPCVLQGSDILLVHRRSDPVRQNTPTEVDVPLFEVFYHQWRRSKGGNFAPPALNFSAVGKTQTFGHKNPYFGDI